MYPQKDPYANMATLHYGSHFSTIEFNATHYKIYSPEKMTGGPHSYLKDLSSALNSRLSFLTTADSIIASDLPMILSKGC